MSLRTAAPKGAKRSALLPNVPTLSESGVKDADVYSWQGIAAPKGLPADVKAKLHAAIVAALKALGALGAHAHHREVGGDVEPHERGERHQRFKHRHFDFLPDAAAFTRIERGDHRIGAGELVVVRGAEPARAAIDAVGFHHLPMGIEREVGKGRQVEQRKIVGLLPRQLGLVLVRLFFLQVQFDLVHLQLMQHLERIAGGGR